jgi:hypothetical protein
MNATDAARLAALQRHCTTHVQRYARAADKASDDRVETVMRDLRSFVAGLRTGLVLMGLSEEAAREVIRKAGWDAKTSTYRLMSRPSILERKDNAA